MEIAQHANFSTLINMMEHLSEPWGIKDAGSRHLYMNKAAYLYTNTPQNFQIEGRFDGEFPAAWAEYEAEMIEHDRRTQAHNGRVAVIETHYWFGQKTLSPYISEKLPLYDKNGTFIGVAWNARLLDTMSPLKYIAQQKPGVLTTEANSDLFTRAELDTLFLLLQRLTAKEIARLCKLSQRTVENRIYTLYQKAGVHTLCQFEEFCHQAGLDHFIPDSLIKKGIQFI
ncbi:helix-turn-helix transcriptional regulator [Erwinia amylovora]|uniref:helix-turn-helix transcriptional regulator n=1 Tax=Erwinia amylovora TaxID=552 RepID=UPI0002C9224F|nr:PAS and helix-turn-helix domain-containing protein [Erwinia amylovora]CCP05813.1 hypothetical protein BN440_0762 [Erwinia amylovora MR1]